MDAPLELLWHEPTVGTTNLSRHGLSIGRLSEEEEDVDNVLGNHGLAPPPLYRRLKSLGSLGDVGGFRIDLPELSFVGIADEAAPSFIGDARRYVYWADRHNIYVTDREGGLVFTTVGSRLSWKVATTSMMGSSIRIDAKSGHNSLVVLVPHDHDAPVAATLWDRASRKYVVYVHGATHWPTARELDPYA